ncbi:MAG TPA: YdeI/OmpD-associated family protein [Candidatus Acidoferrum sp.]|jgi:hypothetical protein
MMSSEENPYVFAAKIQKIWIMRCIDVPHDISKAVRKEAGGNARHIPVHGWIDGLAFENTLVPRGGGNYRFHLHSKIWRKLQIDAGAAVEVTMLLDREPREAVVSPDLAAELADTPRALAAFNTVSPSLRRHIVRWVDAAKQSKTRDKRIQQTVKNMLERARKKTKKKKK